MNPRTFFRIRGIALASLLWPPIALAERLPWNPDDPGAPPPPPPSSSLPNDVLFEPPPMVEIGRQRADALDDDALRDFLNSKMRQIHHANRTVELVRIAPGYPIDLIFDRAPLRAHLGDNVLEVLTTPSGVTLKLTDSEAADVPLTLFFGRDHILYYHVFVVPTFDKADRSIRVHFAEDASHSSPALNAGTALFVPDGRPNLPFIADVIANYDALLQERALDARTIRRIPVGQTQWDGFTVFEWFAFDQRGLAITFQYRNPTRHPLPLRPLKLRARFAGNDFAPRFVHLSDESLTVGASATGFAVFEPLPVALNQPFELAWVP